MLAWRLEAYKNGQKMPNQFEQMRQLTLIKQEADRVWLTNIYSHTLQDVLKNLEKSYKAFFANLEKKEKGQNQSQSWYS